MSRAGHGCTCPCHQGAPLSHPVPCCQHCQRCGALVANGLPHECVVSEKRGSARPTLDTGYGVFPLSIALLVMVLTVYSVPYPARLIFVAVGAIAGVVVLLRLWLRRRL